VTIADGSKVEVVGKGNIMLRIRVSGSNYRQYTLYDVLYIPDLNGNLFSVKAATQRGFVVQFGHSRCWIKNRRQMVCARGTLVNKLYYLDIESDDHSAALSAISSCTLWHQRLAHVNVASVRNMSRWSASGSDLPAHDDIGVCEPCVLGKMARKPFKASGIKSKLMYVAR
jgi:hypothetical protein